MIAKIRRVDNGFIVTTYHKGGEQLVEEERENVFWEFAPAMVRVALAMGRGENDDPEIKRVIRLLRGEPT